LPRFHVTEPLSEGLRLRLPASVARHVQVLRLQPGDELLVFDGQGSEWAAQVQAVARSEVWVQVGRRRSAQRELACAVTLAVAMPANDRMDMVVEKATELGVAVIQPLLTERSVLRLSGDRAVKKVAHWQAVAVAACEQCGRSVLPRVAPVAGLAQWLASLGDGASAPPGLRLLLSPRAAAPLPVWPNAAPAVLALSGPEGGLTPDEEAAALAQGFAAASLGPRVLRADTAPLALLAHVALSIESRR
jgi:16S rRNA (uracil1498-N3)-methyltransferase